MVITDVVGWVIGGFAGVGTVIGILFWWIAGNRSDSDKKHDDTRKDVDTKYIQTQTELSSHARALSVYQENHARDLNNYKLQTENRLGEFIKKEHLDSIIDRYDTRIDRKFEELKELIKAWIERHDRP